MVERRQPKPTVDFIDEYCQHYRNLFSDVRGFEAFKYLHMGMISDIKRKTLPASLPSGGAESHSDTLRGKQSYAVGFTLTPK